MTGNDMKFELDYKAMTLNGKPIMSEDIAMLIANYSHRHPDDEMWQAVVALIVGNNYTQEYKREAHKQMGIESFAAWKKQMMSDPEYRKRDTEKNRNRAHGYRLQLIELLGGKCARCGFTDIRALQFDHINGGGTQEVDNRFNGNHVMNLYYVNHPDEAKRTLQILCSNCNWIKRAEMKEYGSGRPRTVI